jgi:hypothetical protein
MGARGSRVVAAARSSGPRSSGRPARNGAATGARIVSPSCDTYTASGLAIIDLVDNLTRTAYRAMQARDWDGLRLILHPYLHWTAADGSQLRGRTKVIERLQNAAPPAEPVAVELRDGQIYRWQEPPDAPRH